MDFFRRDGRGHVPGERVEKIESLVKRSASERTSLFKRIKDGLLRQFVKLCGGTGTRETWGRSPFPVPSRYFSDSPILSFKEYLSAPTGVSLSGLEDLCAWLHQCVYVSDEERHGHVDVWQSPQEFEGTREGDCEDHALWAWRQCKALDIRAEFVVGRYVNSNGRVERHAWVHVFRDDVLYVLEATSKSHPMLRPLDASIQRMYRPECSVDFHGKTYAFDGQVSVIKDLF